MVQVKICGIQTAEHAVASVEAGADFLGLILAPSRRRVEPRQAELIVEAARSAAAERATPVNVVGVFVNEHPDVINTLVTTLGLDWVQLSGYETLGLAAAIDVPVVKAVRFDGHPSEAEWLAQPEAGVTRNYPLLVDAHVQGSFGGAGVTGDWDAAAVLASRWPVWLAGGLTPDNVMSAVRAVRPAVVDVSSGVETHAAKDTAKIRAFIRAAKHGDAPQTDNAPGPNNTHLL